MSAVISENPPVLRQMEEDDLPEVMRIEQRIYDFPWTESIFRDCLRAGYFCVAYQGDDGLVGYGVMSIGAGECHLLNISIDADQQRRGLGRSMVEQLMELARRHRARIAFLEVRRSNTAARRLYASLGFEEIGRRKDYYPAKNGREQALILAKFLT
jgi:ribosomal-protein-alanine N-acetyltransferase